MTTITFEETISIKKTHFKNIWEFLQSVWELYEDLEDKALLKLAKNSDSWNLASLDELYNNLK